MQSIVNVVENLKMEMLLFQLEKIECYVIEGAV